MKPSEIIINPGLHPVYDLTVDRFHNYLTSSGAILHNCELREIYRPRAIDSIQVHFDYSQMEVRVLAAVSNETVLVEAFRQGKDVHRFVASKVWGIPEEDVTDAQRRYSKMATFSILYGKTIEGFASEFMGGDVAGARKLFRDFYTEFPNIEKWIKERHKQVESNGFVTTLFGNPILIDINNLNQAFRHAQNYPIQSSASSLAAQAIWDLYVTCKARKIGALPLGFTHDASDQDVLIKDLFPFIDTMYECAVTKVDKRWGIPAAIDWELGVDQNRTIELAETKRESSFIREFTFSGTQDAFDAVIERLRPKYKIDFETTKTKSKYNTMMELFITRRAFSKYLGETVTSVSGNLRLELIEV